MSSTRDQIPPRRKRQHTTAGISLDDSSESQPSKRLKSSKAEFYDSLSKVWLTRRALKELDRRTRQTNSPQISASASQRVYQEGTLKQIQRFARHGGPELRDLRGYPPSAEVDPTRAMTSSNSSHSRHTRSSMPTSISSKTRRSSAYDKGFEQHYIDYRIYPKGYDYRDGRTPEPGLEGLYHRLPQPRPSLSPSRFTTSDFRDFERKNDRVISEGKVMSTVFPIISGNADIPNEENLQFTRLESMTGSLTVDPRPDFYDGARLEDIDKEVREVLGPYIIPTGHTAAPVAPNFFMEAKAPHGGADVVKRQAMQDGAYGARAMHSLQSYSKGKPVYDGNAYTVTSTYHAGTGTLKLYATYPTAGPENAPEYHMTQIKGWDLTSDRDTFRQGAAAFRNARDWAQEQRDTLITAANDRARSANPESTRTEGMTYTGWLATLGEAQEPLPQSSAVNEVAGHTYTLPSTFALCDVNEHVDESESLAGGLHTESSTFSSYTYNGPSDTYPVQESETSADEHALDSYATPATSSKRRHRGSQREPSKAPRHSRGKSSQSRHSKK